VGWVWLGTPPACAPSLLWDKYKGVRGERGAVERAKPKHQLHVFLGDKTTQEEKKGGEKKKFLEKSVDHKHVTKGLLKRVKGGGVGLKSQKEMYPKSRNSRWLARDRFKESKRSSKKRDPGKFHRKGQDWCEEEGSPVKKLVEGTVLGQ